MSEDPTLIKALSQRLAFLQKCASGPFTFSGLRKFMLTSVEVFFADAYLRQGFGEHLTCLKYNPENKDDNTIFVELDGKQEVEGDNRRPMVTVRLSDFKPQPSGINQKGDLEEETHDDGATSNFVYLAPDFAVTVEVNTDEYDQALDICEGLNAYFISIKQTVNHLNGIRGVRPMGIIMPKKGKDGVKGWVARTGLLLDLEYSVVVREESPLLKKVVLELSNSAAPLT